MSMHRRESDLEPTCTQYRTEPKSGGDHGDGDGNGNDSRDDILSGT